MAMPSATESACPSEPVANSTPGARLVEQSALDLAGVKDVHRVALAEQEAVASARRRVLELQHVEEQGGHEIGGGQRPAQVAVLLGGDADHVRAQRRGAAAQRVELRPRGHTSPPPDCRP
jgi:hypothetical protein